MRARTSLGLAFLLLPACGTQSGLGDANTAPPPVAVVRGQLTVSPAIAASADSGNIRIELAWYTPGGASDRIVGQDVPVTAALPAQFELSIQGAPPAEAIWTGPGTGDAGAPWFASLPSAGQTFAIGQVLAYEDLNGNGKLDMVGVDATSAPDRIVAGDTSYLLYATGGYGSNEWSPIGTKDGYGFLVENTSPTNDTTITWSPITTPVTLAPTGPEWNLLMCTNYSPLVESNNLPDESLWPGIQGLRDAPIASADLVFPSSDEPLLSCSPGGTQYCIDACPAPNDQFYVCQTYDTGADLNAGAPYCIGHFAWVPNCYTMPSVQPAGWPCTYTPNVDCTPDPVYNRCAGFDAGAPVGDDGGVVAPDDAGVFVDAGG
jgi:hypothetical protein